MPEINPLTNNQIFLKKIAENTGSNYETGDVSEINPLTIDQIFLKEIAANTAGQSGDITELEEKVADNTSAIEAIENVLGAKNLMPVTLSHLKSINTRGTWSDSTYTYRDVTFTCTVSNDIVTSITMNGTANSDGDSALFIPMTCHAGKWLANGGTADSSSSTFGAFVDMNGSYSYIFDEDTEINLNSDATVTYVIYTRTGQTCSNAVFYPMIRDARITDPTYVPYAMTNKELTERVIPPESTITTGAIISQIYVTSGWKWSLFVPLPLYILNKYTISVVEAQITMTAFLTVEEVLDEYNGVYVVVSEDLTAYSSLQRRSQVKLTLAPKS